MKCAKCGRDNRDGAGFCAWCGAPTGAHAPANAAPSVAAQPLTAMPIDAEPAIDPTEFEEEPALIEAELEAAPAAQPDGEREPSETHALAPASDTPPVSEGPMAPGALLVGRYQIVELLESAPEADTVGASAGRTYRARDLGACAACGYSANTPDADGTLSYCEACGAALDRPVLVTLVERVEALPPAYDARFEEAGRVYFVTLDPPAAPDAAPAQSAIRRLAWGRATDKGVRRQQNEDYLETWYYSAGFGQADGVLLGLFLVADGLGGHDAGEVASRLATDSFWHSLRQSAWEPLVRGDRLPAERIDEALTSAAAAANKAVYDARIAKANDMSTTLTLAFVVDGVAHLANVGDSRAYLWNAAGLQQITVDHSLVQRLVDEGSIKREEVYTHPRRNVIYRTIGDRPDVQADLFHHDLAIDDRIILCSDGLWEMVHDDGLEEVLLSEPDPQRACDRLMNNANLAGGDDNITIIIVQVVGE
ncbi:MAG: Stp1/IreP family PP2C-type Ser/Thr phosphatase [Chloroflexi bacterium]|nr:Stp1/IreP family PP2C-type Ser/Thr phosphatase [Chloroflexota bacterium]